MNTSTLLQVEADKQSHLKNAVVKVEDLIKAIPVKGVIGGIVWGSLGVLDIASAYAYATAGLGFGGAFIAFACLCLAGLSFWFAFQSVVQDRVIPRL